MKYILTIIFMAITTCAYSQQTNEKVDQKSSEIEGTLLLVSKLPPAAKSDYPDCYYTAMLRVERIISGQSIPQKVILVLPGFFSRKYAPESKFKVGDKLHATVVPFSTMPDSVKQTQQADDIDSPNLDFYYANKITQIQKFKIIDNSVPFAEMKVAQGENFIRPVDVSANAARHETMRRDLDQINKMLADHGGDWDKWYDSLKDYRKHYDQLYKSKARKWVGNSFYSAGYGPEDPIYTKEFINSIIVLKNYLLKRNIDLILVRVPFKGEVSSDLFLPLPQDTAPNPQVLRMYKELIEADVEIVTDLLPRARNNRSKYPLMYWYQDFDDQHAAEGMSWTIAEALAERVKRYEAISKVNKIKYVRESISSEEDKWRWPSGNDRYNQGDYVTFSAIRNPDGTVPKLSQGKESPILFMGSSYMANPNSERGVSTPQYFSFLTGVPIDALLRMGADLSIFRALDREGDVFLKNRAVCIFQFGPYSSRGANGILLPPPVINPTSSSNVKIASYSGADLKNNIQIMQGTPSHVFTFSGDGNLIVKPADTGKDAYFVGDAGTFRLMLPKQIGLYAHFVIELEFVTKRGSPIITGTYGNQKDIIFRVTYDPDAPNPSEYLTFDKGDQFSIDLHFDFVQNNAIPVIKAIRIYGAN